MPSAGRNQAIPAVTEAAPEQRPLGAAGPRDGAGGVRARRSLSARLPETVCKLTQPWDPKGPCPGHKAFSPTPSWYLQQPGEGDRPVEPLEQRIKEPREDVGLLRSCREERESVPH